MNDPYRTLGVPRDATLAEVKQAYRLLAAGLHPDKHSDDDKAEILAEVNAAYHVLKSTKRRADYDATGSSEDAVESEAMNLVIAAVVAMFESNESLSGRPLARAEAHTRGQMRMLNADVEAREQQVERMKKHQSRVTSNNKTSVMILTALDNVIIEKQRQIDDLKAKRLVGDRVLELLSEIDIEGDTMPGYMDLSPTSTTG